MRAGLHVLSRRDGSEAHRRLHISPALVMACLALTISLGGVSWAATSLPKNSVGTTQLKKNSVTSLKVKNGSLLASDFKPGQLSAGPAGPPGSQGGQGPQGAKGDRGEKGDAGAAGSPGVSGYQIVIASQFVQNTFLGSHTATCPAGKKAIGGGSASSTYNTADGPFVLQSRPLSDGSGWHVEVGRKAAGTFQHNVYAVCVVAP